MKNNIYILATDIPVSCQTAWKAQPSQCPRMGQQLAAALHFPSSLLGLFPSSNPPLWMENQHCEPLKFKGDLRTGQPLPSGAHAAQGAFRFIQKQFCETAVAKSQH